MGILRIKESLEDFVERDPYQLFNIDEPAQRVKSSRPHFWGPMTLGIVAALGLSWLMLARFQSSSLKAGDAPFAYFEIKAIDPEGHPVTGALVRNGQNNLGMTDSFGEWRRFVKVRLGTTVALTLTKKVQGGTLHAVKNIAVPLKLPPVGDLELAGSVQMTRGATKKQPAAERTGAARMATGDLPAKQETNLQTKDGEYVIADEASAKKVESNGQEAAAGTLEKPTRIWFVADPRSRPEVLEVLSALRQRSVELGMKVDAQSPFRIELGDIHVGKRASNSLEGATERRLLVIKGRVDDEQRSGRSQSFSFLRDYLDTPTRTARDILWATTMHIAVSHRVSGRPGGTRTVSKSGPALWALSGGREVLDARGIRHTILEGQDGLALFPGLLDCVEPCVVTTPNLKQRPPIQGWVRQKMRLRGIEGGADVYISGYEARRLDDQIFEYWGVSGQGANVAVVLDGQLIYRGRHEPIPVLGSPSKSPVATRAASPTRRL